MPIPTVNFEGVQISLNKVPAGAIRIGDTYYVDPNKVPEDHKTARLHMPAFKSELAKNGGLLTPDMQKAVQEQTEHVKKKSKNATVAKDARPADANIDTIVGNLLNE
jgi:23S rRNA maturation mini-RNase III